MNAVLYARVSSERQADRDLSIPAQLKALRLFALTKHWQIVEEFIDAAESARSANRPEFQRMIAMARKKPPQFGAILVWKLSRFARNREDSILYKSLLRKHNVQVVSISEPVDESPAGRLLEEVIEVVDEFYSANLAQDAMRGMKENATRGFCNGGTAPYGYRFERVRVGSQMKSTLALEPLEESVVTRIFALRQSGHGLVEIAKALNEWGIKTRAGNAWNKTVVHYLLKNETYTGTLLFNKPKSHQSEMVRRSPAECIRVDNAHPAIIERDAFIRVQALLRARSPRMIHPRLLTSEYLLSGLAYCGWCQRKLIGCSAKSGRFFYYGCQSVLKRGRSGCRAKFIPRAVLVTAVIEKLKARIFTTENLTKLVQLVNEERSHAVQTEQGRLEEARSRTQDLRARLHKLYGALETGQLTLDDLAPRIKELRAHIQELEREEKNLQSGGGVPIQLKPAEIKHYVEDLQCVLEAGSFVERKGFLRSFIRRVIIPDQGDSQTGEIEYALPLVPKGEEQRNDLLATTEVLSVVQVGSPFTITHFRELLLSQHRSNSVLVLPKPLARPMFASR